MGNFEVSKDITAKGALLSKVANLPTEIQSALNNGSLKIVDSVIYAQRL